MIRKEFSVDKLKKSSSFRRYVDGTASMTEILDWDRWIESSDKNRAKADRAKRELLGLNIEYDANLNIDDEWKHLKSVTIDKSNLKSKPPSRTGGKTILWLFRAAAVIILIGSAGFITYFIQHQDSSASVTLIQPVEKTISTSEGQQLSLQFSNGAKVTLNSSSQLTYKTSDSGDSAIEIKLEGEAWFETGSEKKTGSSFFRIITPDGTIRDIGTEFLVSVKDGFSRVVIQQGQIEIEAEDADNTVSFKVDKGERVEFSRARVISRTVVNPTFYSSWATGALVFDRSSISELADFISDRYGISVAYQSDYLKTVELNGTVYFRSLDELMLSVSQVINAPIYRASDSTIYIGEAG